MAECEILLRTRSNGYVKGIVYKKTDEWYIEWQRVVDQVTTSYNEWKRMTTSGTTNDSVWQRVVLWVKTSDNKWQRKTTNVNKW